MIIEIKLVFKYHYLSLSNNLKSFQEFIDKILRDQNYLKIIRLSQQLS